MKSIELNDDEAEYLRLEFTKMNMTPTSSAMLLKLSTAEAREEKLLTQAVAALQCISDFYAYPHDFWQKKYGTEISATNPGRTFADLCNHLVARAGSAGVRVEKDLAKRLLGTSHR